MAVRKLKRGEGSDLIAGMIYESDPLFSSVFGSRDAAVNRISELVDMDRNQYSYRNIYVFDDGGICGMLVGIPMDSEDLDSTEDYRSVLPFTAMVRVAVRMVMLDRLFIKESDGTYIPYICTLEDKRGRGIGTALLREYCKVSKESGYSKVYLEASMDNPQARSLYEREGFECFAVKRSLFGRNGMYHMRKIL